jgi:hypothetical protein
MRGEVLVRGMCFLVVSVGLAGASSSCLGEDFPAILPPPELAAPLDRAFPAASKRVREPEEARFVPQRIDGRQHLCRL